MKYFLAVITLVFVNFINAQVVINEYSCSNLSGGDPDFYGEYEDWFELYNPSGNNVDLNGFYFSDKAGNPTKFQVPGSINVPPNGFLKVFCSGRNTIAGGSEIHTNFKLTQTKPEKIIVADASGTIIDSLTLIPNQNLHSRGRMPDGSNTWKIFTNPSPGASNSAGYTAYATTPSLSLAAGFYSGTQSVTISTPDPNVTIHYTLDGTEPTVASPVYSSPLSIANTTVVRARAFSSDPTILPSFIETNTYFIGVTHTVPVVSICGDQVMNLLNGNGWLRPIGNLELFDRAGTMVAEAVGDYNKHGNDSWAYNQRGFDYIVRDQYGYNYGINYKIFNTKKRKSFQRLIIKAAANDNYPFEGNPNSNYNGEYGGAHIRDAFVHVLSQKADLRLDERSYEACVLYVNGQYWGVYDIREKVDDSDFTDYYYDQDEWYKGSPNDVQFLKTWGGTWSEYGGAQAQTDWNNFVNFVNANNMTVQANWDYVDSVYNWKSLVDYFVLNSFIVTQDWLNWNTAWWRGLNPNGDKKKWRYALWDMDATFNHYINYTGVPDPSANADPCNVDNLPNPGSQGHTTVLNKLMTNDTFKQFYISRYIDLINTDFSCTSVNNLLDSMINQIAPEMPGQIAKWGGNLTQWQNNVNDLKQFITDRCTALETGLKNCYSLTGPYTLTFDVSPAGAGRIKINSVYPPSYVFAGNYYGGIDVFLKANPNNGYVFDHWEMNNHTPIPSYTDANIQFEPASNDNIVAVFRLENEPPLPFNEFPTAQVPTAFSPNGDGFNDILYVYGGKILTLKLEIYNRWGELVFETSSKDEGWDGTYKGEKAPAGVYVYKLHATFSDNETPSIKKTGNITLVR